MTSLGIQPGLVGRIFESIDQAGASLEQGDSPDDFRRAYVRLAELRGLLRSVSEFGETPENRFASWIFWEIFPLIPWGGLHEKTEQWFVANKEALAELRTLTSLFLKDIKRALEDDSYEHFMDASKDFMFKGFKIERSTVPVPKK